MLPAVPTGSLALPASGHKPLQSSHQGPQPQVPFCRAPLHSTLGMNRTLPRLGSMLVRDAGLRESPGAHGRLCTLGIPAFEQRMLPATPRLLQVLRHDLDPDGQAVRRRTRTRHHRSAYEIIGC
jgi:hypothetical protein